MRASLCALLTGAIDYAGLFPPAKLPLEEAFGNYLRYRQEPEAWMLGRFVIPGALLGDLTRLMPANADATPVRLTVLARGGKTVEELHKGLVSDLEQIMRFRELHRTSASIDALDIRLPENVNLPDDPGSLVEEVVELVRPCVPDFLPVYFEAPPSVDRVVAAKRLSACLTQLADRFVRDRRHPVGLGYKLRCGGTERNAFPSIEEVSGVIRSVLDHAVQLKFTAGLHHPLPSGDDTLGIKMHGFVNTLLAAVTYQREYRGNDLVPVLREEDPAAFVFDDEKVRMRDHVWKRALIVEQREIFGLTFGSCSFDEPRDDLRSLGWL